MIDRRETKEVIDLVIQEMPEKGTSKLHNMPIDAILPYFSNVNKSFTRPIGWYLFSENDKALKLIDWLKTRFQRGFDIQFKYGISVDYTLKDWVIQGINYENNRLVF